MWGQMVTVARRDPSVLETVGSALLNIMLSTRGCADGLKFLIDHNVPFLIDEYRAKEGKQFDYDVMHEASWANCTENLRLLFAAGLADATGTANPHTGWPDNVSLLYWPAVGQGDVELVRLLLKYGADPEIRIAGNGERGNTVLQEAASPGRPGKSEVAAVLIEHGAYYDLFSACAFDDIKRLRACVSERADIALSTGEANMTLLHWAARAGAVKCARWLLGRGADTDALTTTRRTPLHMAAEYGAADTLWLLLENGARMNVQDTKGRTPLYRATYQGQVATAEALIVCGADTRIPMNSGKTAIKVARKDCKFLRAGAH